jgi:hypothetical protein
VARSKRRTLFTTADCPISTKSASRRTGDDFTLLPIPSSPISFILPLDDKSQPSDVDTSTPRARFTLVCRPRTLAGGPPHSAPVYSYVPLLYFPSDVGLSLESTVPSPPVRRHSEPLVSTARQSHTARPPAMSTRHIHSRLVLRRTSISRDETSKKRRSCATNLKRTQSLNSISKQSRQVPDVDDLPDLDDTSDTGSVRYSFVGREERVVSVPSSPVSDAGAGPRWSLLDELELDIDRHLNSMDHQRCPSGPSSPSSSSVFNMLDLKFPNPPGRVFSGFSSTGESDEESEDGNQGGLCDEEQPRQYIQDIKLSARGQCAARIDRFDIFVIRRC